MPTKTITTTLYTYEDLPSDEAKEQARQWWIECEYGDPAWWREHCESVNACKSALIDWIKGGYDSQELQDIMDKSGDCYWTGYCDDYLLKKYIETLDNPQDANVTWLSCFCDQAWRDEMEDRMSDTAAIEYTLIANGYYFNESGEIE